MCKFCKCDPRYAFASAGTSQSFKFERVSNPSGARDAYEDGHYINENLQLHNFSLHNFPLDSAEDCACKSYWLLNAVTNENNEFPVSIAIRVRGYPRVKLRCARSRAHTRSCVHARTSTACTLMHARIPATITSRSLVSAARDSSAVPQCKVALDGARYNKPRVIFRALHHADREACCALMKAQSSPSRSLSVLKDGILARFSRVGLSGFAACDVGRTNFKCRTCESGLEFRYIFELAFLM